MPLLRTTPLVKLHRHLDTFWPLFRPQLPSTVFSAPHAEVMYTVKYAVLITIISYTLLFRWGVPYSDSTLCRNQRTKLHEIPTLSNSWMNDEASVQELTRPKNLLRDRKFLYVIITLLCVIVWRMVHQPVKNGNCSQKVGTTGKQPVNNHQFISNNFCKLRLL